MKRLDITAALAALLLSSIAQAQPPAQGAPPQGPPPQGAPGQGAPGQGGPRGMPASSLAKTFDSKALGAPVAYVAYLPADYETSKAPYPVIYALHGMFENSAFLERRNVLPQIQDLVRAGGAPNAIVVTVDGGNNLFINSPKGKYQDMVAKDLVEHIDKTYRTIAKREGRALLGISMGGYGALDIAFQQPSVFGAVATHSAMILSQIPTPEQGARGGQMRAFTSVFGEPVDPAAWKAEDPLELAKTVDVKSLQALYFDCGSEDRYQLFNGNKTLHETLEARKVPHEFGLYPGDHGYEYVHSVLPKSMAFLKAKLAAK